MKLRTAAIALMACLMAETAQGHAHLEKSTPADGSTLSAAPSAVEMTFSEAARLTALSIQKDAEPAQAIRALPAAVDKTLRVALPTLAAGSYALTWRALSQDGHITSGTLHFTIAASAH